MEETGHQNQQRGSFELYEAPKVSSLSERDRSPGVITTLNSSQANSGYLQDLQQAYLDTQKELVAKQEREKQLLQIIAEQQRDAQRSPQHGHFGNYQDQAFGQAEGASGSPSSENIGENVKDARIKHLQRQVTVLQATLHKADGWTEKLSSLTAERDRARDQTMSMAAQISQLQAENEKLKKEQMDLSASFLEVQKKLRLATEDLNMQDKHDNCKKRIHFLEEELKKQQSEVKLLQNEFSSRLSIEKKNLKESSVSGIPSDAVRSEACSQELEYLHKVVDTLKKTVLEQRNFLLAMKSPQGLGALSLKSESYSRSETGHKRNELFNYSGAKSTQEALPHPLLLQSASGSLKDIESSPKGRRLDKFGLTEIIKNDSQRNAQVMQLEGSGLNGAHLFQQGVGVARDSVHTFQPSQKVGSTPDIVYTSANNLNSQGMKSEMKTRGQVSSGIVSEVPVYSRNSTFVNTENDPQETEASLYDNSAAYGNHVATALQKRSSINCTSPQMQTSATTTTGSGVRESTAVPRKISQSEVLARRIAVQAQDLSRSKSENFGRNPNTVVPQDSKSPSNLLELIGDTGNGRNGGVSRIQKLSNAPAGPEMTFPFSKSTYQHWEDQQKFSNECLALGTKMVPPEDRVGKNPAEYIYHAPSPASATSVRVINPEMMSGGHMTAASVNFEAEDQAVWQHATADRENVNSTTDELAEQNMNRSCLNSDRLCPVCNRDFGRVSMEDFQTHVFECFDDENAPETMKPRPALERSCPMCNTVFDAETSQAEYEKHVYGHFVGEGPGENFEILQP